MPAGSATRWLALSKLRCDVQSPVHHKEFRSQSGDDSEENLIMLCTACHRQTHRSDLA
jgi:5-methylcytosine-specific restriction endonuclease McrA